MPSLSVGQADNLLSYGEVAVPKYENGSLTKDQYSCNYLPVDFSKRPVPIPLGSYDPKDEFVKWEGAYPTERSMQVYKETPLMYQEGVKNFNHQKVFGYDPDEGPNDFLDPARRELLNTMICSQTQTQEPEQRENYYEACTTHCKAGEFSDMTMLCVAGLLLMVLIICTWISFNQE